MTMMEAMNMLMIVMTKMMIESDIRVSCGCGLILSTFMSRCALSLVFVCAFGGCEEQQYKSIEIMTNTSLALNH